MKYSQDTPAGPTPAQTSYIKTNLRTTLKTNLSSLLILLLVLLPIFSFALNLISWLRFGVDIPLLDDMRQYASGGVGRLDWLYIMSPANDTLYPVGIILDSLAFRFLDGNSIAYQASSIIAVLGGLLFLQWRLLTICTSSTATRALAFSLTLFMLQPDSYWGWQNMAFHQAVPLLFTLMNVYLVLGKLHHKITSPLIFLFAIMSGFTYTSGAFANLALLVGLLILAWSSKKSYPAKVRYSAIALVIPTIITVSAQLWVLIWVQHGTHRPDAPLAYPWELDFWYFLLGKIGRSLMISTQAPGLAMFLSALILIGAALIAIACIWEAKRQKPNTRLWNVSVSYLCIFGVIFSYLLIISAGRANLRPETLALPTEIFTYGYGRFHFFWACVLWPWVVAYLLEKTVGDNQSMIGKLAVLLLACISLSFLTLNSNIINHANFYRETQGTRLGIVKCLSNGLSHGIPFECPALHPGINMLDVYYRSAEIGASYVKVIQRKPVPLGSNNPPPVFRLTENLNQVIFHHSRVIQSGAEGVKLDTAADPILEIRIPNTLAMKNCTTVQLNGSYHIGTLDHAQMFYLPSGDSFFSEQNSQVYPLPPGAGEFSFEVHSRSGFEGLFRLDPVVSSVPIDLNQIELRCLQSTPH